MTTATIPTVMTTVITVTTIPAMMTTVVTTIVMTAVILIAKRHYSRRIAIIAWRWTVISYWLAVINRLAIMAMRLPECLLAIKITAVITIVVITVAIMAGIVVIAGMTVGSAVADIAITTIKLA